jgi:4-hydroxy-tetrahydrodipicolinate synthase
MAALDGATRRRFVEVVMETVDGHAPVLVGVAQTVVADAAAELATLGRLGAAAAVVAPPFYGPVDARGVSSFYRALREASPIPLIAYNIPAFTKVVLPPESVGELAAEGTIVGIKDSSRDFEYFQRVLRLSRGVAGFSAFTGSDALVLPSLLMGGAGAITVGANVAPQILVRIYEQALAGRWAEAIQDQRELSKLTDVLRTGTFPAGVKAALSLLDLCEATTAPPSEGLSPSETARLRHELEGLGVLGTASPTLAEISP